jgi:hypothetical protein
LTLRDDSGSFCPLIGTFGLFKTKSLAQSYL